MKTSLLNIIVALIAAPFLQGIINRTKALFGGRTGQPLLQPYYDIFKLLRKGAVYSSTTTWVFRLAPPVMLAAVICALLLIPFAGRPGLMAFPGDLFLFAGLLGFMRFFTVMAALDTGSSFEGMGASREVQFSALCEPVLLMALAAIAVDTGSFSLSKMLPGSSLVSSELLLAAAALFTVFLCENARIPFDDPNTHLELTMIHEVMVLDTCGPDLGMAQYAAALKFWVLGALLVGLLVPSSIHFSGIPNLLIAVAGMGLLAVVTGIIESVMARLRLLRVPQLLTVAAALSIFSLIIAVK